MGIRTWLRKWLADDRDAPQAREILSGSEPPVELDVKNAMRLTVGSAINGHVIQIGRFKPNPHGPDWTYDTYLVPEGTDMVEALKTCITLGALTK